MKASPTNITKLGPKEIFVFGSNLAGRHGKGAALTAKQLFGARQGIGAGRQGQSYGIPTKDENLKVLPLPAIQRHIDIFRAYARLTQWNTFLVTEIGCGLAGYKPEQLAPFFSDMPDNVQLPQRFIDILKSNGK